MPKLLTYYETKAFCVLFKQYNYSIYRSLLTHYALGEADILREIFHLW